MFREKGFKSAFGYYSAEPLLLETRETAKPAAPAYHPLIAGVFAPSPAKKKDASLFTHSLLSAEAPCRPPGKSGC